MSLQHFRSYHAAIAFYQLCEQHRCPAHLRDQLQRAASSIVLNLAEGSAKPTARDRAKFYAIALGTLRECQAILAISKPAATTAKAADQLAAQVYRLTRATK